AFAGTGFFIPDGGGDTSTVTVSGITNAVTAIWIKVNGLTNTYPQRLNMWFGDPFTGIWNIMDGRGGTNPVGNVNLVFDDRAAAQIGTNSTLVSGTYRPQSPLTNLLSAAPTAPL